MAQQENPVTAIDIALEPDATMIQHAEAANARLRKVFPRATLWMQRTDRTLRCYSGSLDGRPRQSLRRSRRGPGRGEAAGWTLKAFKYDYVVWDKAGVTVILIEPTDQLIQFQQKLIDAVAPFTVETGTAAAFFTTPEHPDINQPTIDYVTRFVPNSSGKKLVPHVTVGVAPPDYLKTMVAEPFDAFTFSPAALSVYQLGNFGTARKKLKAWEFKP